MILLFLLERAPRRATSEHAVCKDNEGEKHGGLQRAGKPTPLPSGFSQELFFFFFLLFLFLRTGKRILKTD